MNRTLRWILLAAALSGPASAQEEPAHRPQAAPTALAAFANAFMIARRLYIEPVSAKTLLLRAMHGLAVAPTLASPAQKRVIAAASAQMGAMAADDAAPLLRSFGNALDALHATAGGPALDGMLRAAAAGMLDGLDSRTRFLSPTPTASTAGEGAAGLRLKAGPNGPLVVQAYARGPAAEAGIQRDDEVVSIGGHLTKDVPLEEVFTLLRGPVGSSATLLIRRGKASAPITVELTRAVIRVPLIVDRDIGSVAYLHVETFAPGAAQGLRRAFADLQSHAASPITGVVLDLRDNTGGRLTEAVATADEFLPPSTLIATTTAREASGNQRFTAGASDITGGVPMVVLVNEETGAGAEIVAAALQKGRGAVLMGSHTAGAGLVATVIPLPPLGAMSVTTQQIILASGQLLKPPGILPQVALIPGNSDAPSSLALEAPSSDPAIVRLRRGIPQTPQAGESFDDPDAPQPDFEVRQACAALAMLPAGTSSHS